MHRTRKLAVAACLAALVLGTFLTAGCGRGAPQPAQDPTKMVETAPQPRPADGAEAEPDAEPVGVAYAWLMAEQEGIPAGTPARLVDTRLRDGKLKLRYGDATKRVDARYVLVNLPDLEPDMAFDIAFSHGAVVTSNGADIDGLTGRRLPHYRKGRAEDEYLGAKQFVAPLAYGAYRKVHEAAEALREAGYRLKVYDAYRPRSASTYLFERVQSAYESSSTVQAGIDPWSVSWFAARGMSSHNVGSAVDVTLVDGDGTEVQMPSAMHAFDTSAKLTSSPVATGSISPGDYSGSVRGNDACLALHEAFRAAGMTELASEWWHFQDQDAYHFGRDLTGGSGLDFTADLD